MRATVSEEMEQQPESDNSDIPEDNPTLNTPTPKVDISLVNAVIRLRCLYGQNNHTTNTTV